MENEKYYFAYGSNMVVEQMRHRCPDSTFYQTGKLPAYRFLINSREVATVVPDSGSEVYGVIWKITKSDEDSLDRYEGVRSKAYYKAYKDITLPDGKVVNCLLYIASDDKKGSPRNGYLEKIIAAAHHHKLPDSYIKELESQL